MERLDEAVTRILRVKFRAGVFEAGPPSSVRGRRLQDPGIARAARGGARCRAPVARAAQEQRGLLPLAANRHVLVAGDGADNISKQTGGWTITWQGTGLSNADFPGGTSVWGGIRRPSRPAAVPPSCPPMARTRRSPTWAVVVFGENPYANSRATSRCMTLPGSMTEHLEIMKKLQDEKIPVVAVLLWAGRCGRTAS